MPLSRFKLCQQIAKFNTPCDHYGTVNLSANDDLEVKSRQTEQTFYPCSALSLQQAAGSKCDSRVYRYKQLSRCKFRFLELYFYHNESLEKLEKNLKRSNVNKASFTTQQRRSLHVVNKFASHAQLTFAPLYDKDSIAK